MSGNSQKLKSGVFLVSAAVAAGTRMGEMVYMSVYGFQILLCSIRHLSIWLKKIISYFTIKPFANQDIFPHFVSMNIAKEKKLKKLTAQLSVG